MAAAERRDSTVSPFRRGLASGCAREQGKNFPEDLLAGNGLRKRLVRHDLVAVATVILVLADATGRCQVSDDAMGAALNNAQAGRHVMQPHRRGVCEKHHTAVVTHEAPAAHTRKHYHDFWKKIANIVSLARDHLMQPDGPARPAADWMRSPAEG
jgi:hypothetical protein